MRAIGIRELRQNASQYLRAVERGETIEVTNHGRPVARLTPVPAVAADDRYAALVADGVIAPAHRKLSSLAPPLPVPGGSRTLSDVLLEMRDDDDR